VIYVIGRDDCVWCDRAKELLEETDHPYTYHNLDGMTPEKRSYWIRFIKDELNCFTLPAVFSRVGGYEELKELFDD